MHTVLYDKLSGIKANIRDTDHYCCVILSLEMIYFNLNVALTVFAYMCLNIFNKPSCLSHVYDHLQQQWQILKRFLNFRNYRYR